MAGTALKHDASPPKRDGAETAFLAGLGARVKAARALRGLSRKALSDRSGVSERYIAQLEGGAGNISVLLLWNLARSMGVELESLLGEPGGGERLRRLVSHLRALPPDELDRIADLVEGTPGGDERLQRIALIGLRGAGKSTLGRLAARDLNMPFVELKTEIEAKAGLELDEIFSLFGPEGYRRLERQCLEAVTGGNDRLILAVAGGIVSDPETYGYLKRHYWAVWLRADPADHMERVMGQGDRRPMEGNPAAMEELRDILDSRLPLYAQAPLNLDTAGRTVDQSLRDLVALLDGYV